MDARAQAEVIVGARFHARVLEPSPPAVHAPPWHADDPVLGWQAELVKEGLAAPALPLLLPVCIGELTWDDVARADPALANWCADRWLGAWRRLPDLPATFAATRDGLHRVAEHVLAPARYEANGKIGLRYTAGGFGTPFFADDRQVRIRGGELVVQVGAVEQRAALTTVRNAAAIVGVAAGAPSDVYPPSTPLEPDARLRISPDAAAALGDWFGFACSVLEQLRAEAAPDEAASRVQLWPEHFDLAVEIGREEHGSRAAFGASAGDDLHPEPYLYVAPWEEFGDDPYWNATGFRGAELGYADLARGADQRAAALLFLRRGRSLLRHNDPRTG